MGGILSQSIHILNHHSVHYKYLTILSIISQQSWKNNSKIPTFRSFSALGCAHPILLLLLLYISDQNASGAQYTSQKNQFQGSPTPTLPNLIQLWGQHSRSFYIHPLVNGTIIYILTEVKPPDSSLTLPFASFPHSVHKQVPPVQPPKHVWTPTASYHIPSYLPGTSHRYLWSPPPKQLSNWFPCLSSLPTSCSFSTSTPKVFLKYKLGISLVVQWLRLFAFNAGMQETDDWSLVEELRSHMLHSAAGGNK